MSSAIIGGVHLSISNNNSIEVGVSMNQKKIFLVILVISSVGLGTFLTPSHRVFAASRTESIKTLNTLKIKNSNQQSDEGLVPDDNLKHVINKTLNRDKDTVITKADLESLTSLDAYEKNVQSIEGLQYCINLRELKIGTTYAYPDYTMVNTIDSLKPLEKMISKDKLEILQAGNLEITDFSPLKDFKNLKFGFLKSYFGDQTVTKIDDCNGSSYTLKIPCKNIDGTFMEPYDKSGGVYDKANDTITWSREDILKHSTHGTGNELGMDQHKIPLEFKSPDLNKYNVRFELCLNVKTPGREVGELLESLFQNRNPHQWALADTVTAEQIADSKAKLDALTDKDVFYEDNDVTKELHRKDLLIWYDRADIMFKDKQETLKLFWNNNENSGKLAPNISQADVDKVTADITTGSNKLEDGTTKTQLLDYVQKAQAILNGSPTNKSEYDTKGTINLQAPLNGSLTLNTNDLPSSLSFDPVAIDYSQDTTLLGQVTSIAGSKSNSTKIEVTDRRGTKSGWQLELEQIDKFKASDGTALDGAQLTIETDKVTNQYGTVPTSGIGGTGVNTPTTLVPNQKIVLLKANAPQTTPLNKSGEGDGISTMNIQKYQLIIPGLTSKKATTYSTQLEWTFSDTI